MKKIIYFLIFIPFITVAQVGIDTTDPRTALDVNGAITNREVSFTVASNAANINTETSLANLIGTATALITVSSFTPTVNGCRLIVSNNTTGGFGATFAGMTIPNGQAIEFVYSNGAWKTTAGGTGAANNIYNSNGTLTANRVVTQGTNTLAFTSNSTNGFSVDGTTFSVDAVNNRVGVGTASPAVKLDVAGTGAGTIDFQTTGRAKIKSDNAGVWFTNGANLDKSFAGFENSITNHAFGVWSPTLGAWSFNMLQNGNIGIGTPAPHAQLQIANSIANRKIILWEDGDNDHKFYGFGINSSMLRYQVSDVSTDHVFYAGVTGTTSNELLRIKGNGNVGIGVVTPTAQLHTTGTVRFAGAGTPAVGRSLVTDATGLATWQNPLASNTTSTAIAASTTQVAVPSTNVQGAISDLATAIKTTQNSTIYTSDGTLTGNRIVTQGANTLTFNSTVQNGFSVDGTTFSVDGANNRIGIGNTAPNLSLDVTSGNGIGVKVSNAFQWDHLYLFSDTVSSFITAGGADNGLHFRVGSGASGTYGGQTYTTAMTIMPSGNIGIGTTNPFAPLQFANVIENRKTVLWQDANNDHQFYGFGINANALRYQVSSTNANHIFFAGTGTTASNELMRIQGNGRVGIGTTTPLAKLDLIGVKTFGAGAGTGGSNDNPSQAIIPAGNNGTSRFNDWPAGWGGGLSTWDIVGASTFMNGYITRSDYRLKSDIKSIDDSIFSNFMKIRPVTYFMKEDTKETEGLQYGFIAQEIRDLFPSMVTKSDNPNGIIGMNYQALISPTIYVVQQQQAKIDELQKQVDSQNEKLSKMEEELKQIKQLLSK